MATRDLEKFFLNTLLRICIVGVVLIFASDAILYPQDHLSLMIDASIFTACISAYIIRNRYPTISILTLVSVVLGAMLLQCVMVPVNTTTSLSIILVIGFIISLMLKGRLMWGMHILTYVSILAIFAWQYLNPAQRFSTQLNDLLTVAITYSIIYFILSYATAVMKSAYDKLLKSLEDSHKEINQKADEIAQQNEELITARDKLNEINSHLEGIINQRTALIQEQNKMLLKYSYTNAHHLRGPVARLLGLARVYRLDVLQDPEFIISRMEEQATEIDAVVKKINTELETDNLFVEARAKEEKESESAK